MSDSVRKLSDSRPLAPPLAPIGINEIVQDADALISLMGKESLDVVAELADTLAISAHDAGAWDIEEAARNIGRLAASHGPVVLTPAMRALTDAIARTERSLAA
jgi:hypothetical protein